MVKTAPLHSRFLVVPQSEGVLAFKYFALHGALSCLAPAKAHHYFPTSFELRFERLYLRHGFPFVLRHFGKDSWNHRIAEKIVTIKKKGL